MSDQGEQRSRKLSEDGRWWWDGQAWQPTGSGPAISSPLPPAPPTGAAGGRSGGGLGLLAGVGAALLLLAVCGGLGVAIYKNSGAGSGPSHSPTASQKQLVDRYVAVATPNLKATNDALNNATTQCSGSSLVSCRSALQRMLIQVQGFQRDLAGVQVPTCLVPMDTELRAGLDLYVQGDQTSIAGIDRNNSSQLVQGGSLIDQGSAHINRAGTLLQQASCPT